jgi:hypothetical protein
MKLLRILISTSFSILTAAQNNTNFNTTLNSTFSTTGSRNIRYDTGTYGPSVEEFHYYYDQWSIGLAISQTGRVFTCYTRGSYAYTLGEVVNQTAERAYPSQALNTPPGGLYSTINGIQFGSNDPNTFISVKALYIAPDDTLWVLDTGHPISKYAVRCSRWTEICVDQSIQKFDYANLYSSFKCPLSRLLHERSPL